MPNQAYEFSGKFLPFDSGDVLLLGYELLKFLQYA